METAGTLRPSAPRQVFTTVGDLAKCLVDANRMGRPIIPVVGAGISADSGFPVIVSIVRYFGKLRLLIDKRLWLLGSETLGADPLAHPQQQYAKEPWKYVRDFGWPDRFQVNEDLWTALEDDRFLASKFDGAPGEGSRLTMSQAVNLGLDELLQHSSHSWRMATFGSLRDDLLKSVDQLENEVVQPRLNLIKANLSQRLIQNPDGRSVPWDLFGEWKRMILDFTRFQSDYADALLARFARDREPNLAHRYLAFLIRRLNVPVIFTMNFDPFIEQVLQEEDLRPRTFAMEHGLTLPHASLVREQLAVIKMHGSTHALLLDEQLDRPLSRDYLKRFERIVGKNPLLLVIGCSGEDNRLLDLARQAIEQQAGDDTRVAWVHYEPEMANSVQALCPDDADTRLRYRRTKNIGGTLMHLYSEIDQLHPASRSFYLTHFQQPVVLNDPDERQATGRQSKDGWMRENTLRLLQTALTPPKVFVPLESITPLLTQASAIRSETSPPAEMKTYPDPSASRQLLWMGSSLPPGFNLIWVDLEAEHTLSAVAGSIIDQCRKFDSTLAPCVLPQDKDNNIITSALDRVERALRRSRYFVAFDGLEAYTWSPTAHHGDTHSTTRSDGEHNLRELISFLDGLARRKLSESCFAVSVDPSRSRTDLDSTATHLLPEMIKQLKGHPSVLDWNDAIKDQPPADLQREYRSYDEYFQNIGPWSLQGIREWDEGNKARKALALSILATFRRTRPLALAHQVLRPVLGEEGVADFLMLNQRLGVFQQLEGGGVWFYRELRDHIYRQNTDQTSASKMGEYLADKSSLSYQDAIFQLLLNTASHQLVARAWYAGAFIQSHDTFSLLEYFYHRLASVRILTKLIGLVQHAEKDIGVRYAWIKDGVDRFEAVIKEAAKPDWLLEAFEIREKNFFVLQSGNPEDALINFRLKLVWRHGEELDRLLRVWRKSESVLRAQVPAEQLLRWCEQFLYDDLKYRCHSIVTGYEEKDESQKTDNNEIPKCHVVEALQEAIGPIGRITQLKEYVEDFNAKILIDRSDYKLCSERRRENFQRDREGKNKELDPAQHKTTDIETFGKNFLRELDQGDQKAKKKLMEDASEEIRFAHHWLDIVWCNLRSAQETNGSDADISKDAKKYAGDLSAWKWLSEPEWIEGEPSGMRELQLRGLHLLSNCHLERICVFSHAGFSGTTKCDEHGKPLSFSGLKAAKEAIDSGTMVARLQSQSQTPAPHSATINAVVDGTLYLPYRGTFLMQHARWRWMDAVNLYNAATSDAAAARSATSQVQGSPSHLLGAVDEALREFEKARAGLSGTNNLTLALTDLHATEACLAHARIILGRGTILPKLEGVDCFTLARARYESARGLLARARNALLGAQRNVIWWRLYFQLTTQYHVDRLLLGFANLFRDLTRIDGFRADPSKARLGIYLLRLRKGYESLKNAYDLYLRDPVKPLVWLPRLERELTLSGCALGLVTWHLYSGSFFVDASGNLICPRKEHTVSLKEREVTRYLCKQLHWLVKTAGFRRHPGKSLHGESNFAHLYEEMQRAVSEVSSPSPQAEVTRSQQDKINDKARELRDLIIKIAHDSE